MESNNLNILSNLRNKPLLGGQNWQDRLSQVDSLLDQQTLNATIQNMRWPKGTQCPRCHSTRIRVLTNQAHGESELPHYQCIPCETNGFQSIFTALTDLPEDWIFHLRQLLMCWFMQRVCSISQIANKFGLSPALLKQFIQWYDQQMALEETAEPDQVINRKLKNSLTSRETVDGRSAHSSGGRFTVDRDGFQWDGEEVRVAKDRRLKNRK